LIRIIKRGIIRGKLVSVDHILEKTPLIPKIAKEKRFIPTGLTRYIARFDAVIPLLGEELESGFPDLRHRLFTISHLEKIVMM
jgi:hypothetical protein